MACKRSGVQFPYPPIHKALNCNGLRLFLLIVFVPLVVPLNHVPLSAVFGYRLVKLVCWIDWSRGRNRISPFEFPKRSRNWIFNGLNRKILNVKSFEFWSSKTSSKDPL